MNKHNDIKQMLERYFEGVSSDADEENLLDYFSSNNIDEELKIYQPIFAYITREQQKTKQTPPRINHSTRRYRLIICSAAAILGFVIVLMSGLFSKQPAFNAECTGTFVMIDGICYSDLSLVSKHVLKTLDQITSSQKGIYNALDFLDEFDLNEDMQNSEY